MMQYYIVAETVSFGTDLGCILSFHLFCDVSAHAEKAMAPHSSTLAWNIPWTEEPGGLQYMGLLRVGHD